LQRKSKFIVRSALTLVALLFAAIYVASAPAAASDRAAALNASLQETVGALRPLGAREAVLLIETPAGTRLAAAFGPEGAPPPDAGTLFQIGSQTKWFTAAAVLLLEKEGALDLDDPVSKYIPALEGVDGVLLRHLLTHTSGIGDAVEYLETDGAPPQGHFTFDQLAFLSRLKGTQFSAGERYAYNNFAFDVLGRVIEVASGQSREAFVRTRILEPLSMDDAYFGETGDWPAARAARGFYNVHGDAIEMTGPRDLSWASAAGDMLASGEDLLTWLNAVGGAENPAGITLKNFTEIRVNSGEHHADMPEYGLGLMHRTFGGRPTWGHGGVIHGYITYAGIDEQSGVRFVLMTATDGKPTMSVGGLLGGVSMTIGAALQLTVFALDAELID
jgi:CubicO group peptidase (beta-lactamase class C family)